MPHSLQPDALRYVSLQPLSKGGAFPSGGGASKKSVAKDCGDEKTGYLCRPVEQTGTFLESGSLGSDKIFEHTKVHQKGVVTFGVRLNGSGGLTDWS